MGEVSDPEQQYSLRWNDFHASILSSFRHLRDEEDFVDVTLACDGCSFTAHKVVLSACSPYFRRLLKANPCQHPIVILRDVREKDMESLLRFMYNGEVHIGQEQLSDFLKTAQMLQVRGLADVPTKDNQKIPPTSNSLPWSQSGELRDQFSEDPLSPPRKRSRNNEHRFSPSPASSATNNNNNGDPLMRETLLGQALEGGPTIHTGSTSHQNKGNSDSSLQAQSTGEDSNSSDTNSERGPPIGDLIRPKLEPNDYSSVDDNHHHHGNGNLGLDPTRTPPFPAAALLGLQNIPGLLPGPSGLHNNSQDANFVSRRGLDVMRVRATDPRPCPKCGKIYRSAHTLRTHLEDKHTVCPGYRCVLCGTVAKSRNSLHSHMSRQHRGISTKDLPVLPMPSPFDPDLASRLLAKAGVKVSAAELRARASPTGPRRPDVRLEVKSNHIGAPSEAGSSLYGGDDPEDLTVANSRFGPLSPPPPTVHNSAAVITKVGSKHHHGIPVTSAGKSIDSIAHNLVVGGGSRMGESNRVPPPPPPPPLPAPTGSCMGSAILDTYLQFIAENSSNSLGLGLSSKHAAVAAVAAAMNEGDNSKLGEREENEIGEVEDRGADEEIEELESSAGEEEDEYSEEEQEVIKAE
ncbi:protein abrupt [Zootermopsis nevadensis]|uniref:protein abrupt n=1 Tax=Zootermopsis nevadensis TaxID=136037 RepID=UPI000B8E6928|nr:protein abrupt [Zootermopsis nevadensis]XP_021935071.1 protein abrupt [Zootermopsis nevadensis]XP_021935072.1 protein abrupt [Zootermopsis nevadensis]XP_021935073.1 protein abrupt [Zootermopsis nevadensis]XP_021935074.1 protein abrupt [Zootermopsis nevadensis]XP_021935076.1 protein abrupt [Zootermopsis nevadensis]XP_021935077.1 protein abrupt [Zootermopsis nevadensis]XP_021935078.1 protein abrupt [Zootermopsis nevadensis]XP_021935079.1 protein abrupt [Zootermopsis nevadensis]XP_02193508